MESGTLSQIVRSDAQMMLDDARSAITAISKNSKLRAHYLKLVMMNNIMRAFVTMFDLKESYTLAQKSLLETLCRVEARMDRRWFTSDKIALEQVWVAYEELLSSAEIEQLQEVMEFVQHNREAGQWGVMAKKSIKSLRHAVTKRL